MARPKHDWIGLKAEFDLREHKTLKEFAESKGLNYNQVRNAFKGLEGTALAEKLIKKRTKENQSLKTGLEPVFKGVEPKAHKSERTNRTAQIKAHKSKEHEPQAEDHSETIGEVGDKKRTNQSAQNGDGSHLRLRTSRQETFINEKIRGKTNTEAAKVAGYARPSEAGSRLLAKPEIACEIIKSRQQLREEFRHLVRFGINRLAEIAETDLQDVMDLSTGEPRLATQDGRLPRGLKKVEIKTFTNEEGTSSEYRFEVHDPARAIDLINKLLGTADDNSYNHLESGNPAAEDIWTRFLKGEINAYQAAHAFQAQGLGVPPSIMAHMKAELTIPDPPKDIKSQSLDYDALEARSQRSKEEVERQLKEFLPQRMLELKQISEEFGDGNNGAEE